uniref:Peptidase_S24 domain-containing protein n=3 Tax=Rhodnius TaxID=13248 RepID=T1I1N5_RHOPR
MALLLKQCKKLCGRLLQAVCIAHCTLEHVADLIVCCGPSMEPTLFTDNVVLCEHLSKRRRGFVKGDIVISRSMTAPELYICKRVTGVAGDYVWSGYSYTVVPRGHIWLEGDNATNSTDSREYGPVPLALVRGRVILRLWPLTDI